MLTKERESLNYRFECGIDLLAQNSNMSSTNDALEPEAPAGFGWLSQRLAGKENNKGKWLTPFTPSICGRRG